MDTQLKRGLLEGAVLAALRHGDSYGYQIVKDVSPHVEISESTLYPILRRLGAAGLLVAYAEEHQGRLRKYYHLTDKGRERVAELAVELLEVEKANKFIAGAEL